MKVELSGTRMVHDFAVTENFIVIPDLPFEICAMDAITHAENLFQLKKDAPTRYGLLPRNATSEDEVTWFDFTENHYCFHYANAYETVENGDNVVVMHGGYIKKFDSLFNLQDEHPLYKN